MADSYSGRIPISDQIDEQANCWKPLSVIGCDHRNIWGRTVAWTVEYGWPKDRAEQENPPEHIIQVAEASGRADALTIARSRLGRDQTVWCIKDEDGHVVMDRDQVWRAVNGGSISGG